MAVHRGGLSDARRQARDALRELAAAGRSLAIAESCTGGIIQALLVENPGASRVFRGGVVAYANALKAALVGVPEDLLAARGGVDRDIATAMATGMRERSGVDFALGITGIAGPTGGTADKPVGTVFIALAHPGGTTVVRRRFAGGRLVYRHQVAAEALRMVRGALSQTPGTPPHCNAAAGNLPGSARRAQRATSCRGERDPPRS